MLGCVCVLSNYNMSKFVLSSCREYLLLFINAIKKVDFQLEITTWLSVPLKGEFKEDCSLINCHMTVNKSTYVNYRGNTDDNHYRFSA